MNDIIKLIFNDKYVIMLMCIILLLILLVILYILKIQKKETFTDEVTDNKDVSLPLETEFKFENKYDDDEDTAIISADELKKARENYKETYGVSSQEIISKYEEEQEQKAVISYEELLKNASSLKNSFKEPNKTILNNIVINEEPKDIKKVNNYIEEELFLKTIKDFRLNLK
ncbi:MAG: hypothetical protein RSD00_01775 [Bacilli bacterium]